MKVLNKLVVGAAALVLLTACGPSKVSYAKFHEQAVAAVKKEVSYKKVTVKGTASASSVTMNLDLEYTLKDGNWEMTKGDAVSATVGIVLIAFTADGIEEDEKTTYYAGGGFKVTREDDGEKATMTWNANARLTSAKGNVSGTKTDVKLTWSK